MGIKELWAVIGDGKTMSLAKLSTEFYEKHHRPIRIAADFPQWMSMMRAGGLAGHIRHYVGRQGTVKEAEAMALTYRLLEIQRLNVQFIVVFDGPRRFERKIHSSHFQAAAARANQEPLEGVEQLPNTTGLHDAPDSVKSLFGELGIPHTRAPGDCEAECCRLAELGIVDAVWSADSDCVMFGAKTMLSRRGTTVSDPWHTFCVLDMSDVQQKTGLTKEGAIIFAILTGCDYGSGLADCSTELATRIATEFPDLRSGLPFLTKASMDKWRTALWEAIVSLKPDWEARSERGIFPPVFLVHACCRPIRSSDKALLSLPCLRNGWVKPYGPDLRSAYDFVRDTFQPLWPSVTPPIRVLRILAAVELNSMLMLDATNPDGKTNPLSIVVKRRCQKAAQTSVIVRADAIFPNLAKECPDEFSKQPAPLLIVRVLDCILRKALPGNALREEDPPRAEDTSDEEMLPPVVRTSTGQQQQQQQQQPPPHARRGRKRKRAQMASGGGSSSQVAAVPASHQAQGAGQRSRLGTPGPNMVAYAQGLYSFRRVTRPRDRQEADGRCQNPSVSPQRAVRARAPPGDGGSAVPQGNGSAAVGGVTIEAKSQEPSGSVSDHGAVAGGSDGTGDQADVPRPIIGNDGPEYAVYEPDVPIPSIESDDLGYDSEVADQTAHLD